MARERPIIPFVEKPRADLTTPMPEFKIEGENVSFWLRVKPRAAHDRLRVDASGELRLELQAPATEGQANEACVSFFARALRLPKASVVIVSGQKARRKLLRVTGRSAQLRVKQIEALAAASGEGINR
jgi:uncharacterized protein (TIGR00251 family)